MWKFIIFLVIVGGGLYFINSFFDNKPLEYLYTIPKIIAIIVAMAAIMFPRDWDRLPEIIVGKSP